MELYFWVVKIVHLNTYAGNGGAGRACMRLNKALKAEGLDSELAVNFLFRNNPEVHNLSKGFFSKWFTAAGIILERITAKLFTKDVPIPFSFPVWGKDISGLKLLRSADIIHLHWINHAFLRPEDIVRLSSLNKPIVWTFHDSNAFTGGCHVRYDCDHFLKECGDCPVLKYPGPDDSSHRIWKRKAKAYSKLNLTIIAPSKWMADSVKKSSLLGMAKVVNIPNTLDTKVFKPSVKSEARTKLGLNPDKFILMSGFMPSRKDLHKGTPYLIEAIELFIRDHQVSPDLVELVVFGNRDEKNVSEFPIHTTFLGTIADDEKLALCYSAADVFLAPSLEDNLPNTVMESLACGTPLAAFTTGGIPDMVKHKHNGYLADYRSSADMAAGIAWIYNYPNRAELNFNARQTIEEHFSESIIAGQHIDLYKTLLNNHVPA
ncbi:Glycosyltransferase involved in cell wall bisynthesis [Daejeonella rubra]|uniref:Glycosyltransferase involved in cell wall bisynthesis n=1 Tax=Daejeonella rubra TaxID=990371 RepID=A0A1G9WJU9_9SPHI|nr:glycosyltransferase [Daejeonella rubra]SDM84749.1 Glycosyltransferase involved in cell wall bisynthesis [Daejeonella rubra]